MNKTELYQERRQEVAKFFDPLSDGYLHPRIMLDPRKPADISRSRYERPSSYRPPPFNTKPIYNRDGEIIGYTEKGLFDCFVATACMQAKGISDCEELDILRSFRDGYICKKIPLGALLVRLYYCVGPRIVKKINSRYDADHIYSDLYERLVKKMAGLISEDKKRYAFFVGVKTIIRLCLGLFFLPKYKKSKPGA